MATVAYLPSTASHTVMRAVDPKFVNSTWLYRYKNNSWPVVISDEQGLPEIFLNARRSTADIPVILLGKRILIWVLRSDLEPFDLRARYRQAVASPGGPFPGTQAWDDEENLRQTAFSLDALEFSGAERWKKFVKQRSDIRKAHKAPQGTQKKAAHHSPKEIERGPGQKLPHLPARARQSRQLLSPQSNPTKPKRSLAQVERNVKKRARNGIAKNTSVYNACGLTPTSSATFRPEIAAQRREYMAKARATGSVPHQCYLFVGQTKEPFSVHQSRVNLFDFLRTRMQFNDAFGHYVDLSDLAIDANDFYAIHDFMIFDDFDLDLANTSKNQSYVEDMRLNIRDPAVELASVYRSAAILHMGALQKLVREKFDGLHPLDSSSFITVARLILSSLKWGWEGESEVEDWVADYLAEFWWSLNEEHTTLLGELSRDFPGVLSAVFAKLSSDPIKGRRGPVDCE